jgi:hypothetical protein
MPQGTIPLNAFIRQVWARISHESGNYVASSCDAGVRQSGRNQRLCRSRAAIEHELAVDRLRADRAIN